MPVDRIPVERLFGIWIDKRLVEEVQAKLMPGHLRTHHQLDGNEHHDAEDAQGAEHHQPVEAAVGDGRVAAREQERSNRGDLARKRLLRTLLVWSVGLGLKLRLGDPKLGHLGYHLS